jgi:hydroxyacylglutathione hydrolase
VKKYKNIYSIVGSVVLALGLVAFSLYATKCHGDECNVEQQAAVITAVAGDQQIFPKMSPAVINEQVKNKEIVLLDVREDSEWDAGHIAGAEHIALGNINSETTKNIPRDVLVYTYCRSGKRAKEAETKLQELGFSKAEDLGGIIYWQERGGELVK